jgi:hypothetical protein
LVYEIKYFKTIIGVKKGCPAKWGSLFLRRYYQKSLGQGENPFKTQAVNTLYSSPFQIYLASPA